MFKKTWIIQVIKTLQFTEQTTFATNKMPKFNIIINSDSTITENVTQGDSLVLQNRQNANEASLKPLFLDKFPVSGEVTLKKSLPFTPKVEKSNTSFFFAFLAILIFWAFFYQRHHKGLNGIIKSFFSNNVLFNELNDKSGANGIVSLGMFLLGIATLSIFLFQALEDSFVSLFLFDLRKTGVAVLIIGFAVIFGLFIKTLIILITGVIFDALKTMQGYLTLLIVSIQITGIILLPITIIHTYGNLIHPLQIVNFGAIIIALTFLYRLIRSFLLGVKQTNSQAFHIILYICALEILPLLVIGRYIILYS